MASAAGRVAALPRSRWGKLALQLLVGVALIAALLALDPRRLLRLLAGADPLLVALVVALTFVYTFLLSERWRVILRGLGAPTRPWPAFDLTMRGYFFGTFLPSNAGGDVVKAYLIGRRGVPLVVAFLSALLDRLAGLVALAWVGGLAVWLAPALADTLSRLFGLALLGVGVGVTVVIVLGPRLVAVLEPAALRLAPAFARAPVAAAAAAVRGFGQRPLPFVVAAVLSIPLQLFYVAQVYLLMLALHAPVDVARLTWAVTWATLAGALPISFSGFGPRETAFAMTLGANDVGVAIGLLTGAMQVISGVPGGVTQLLSSAAPPLPAADAPAPLDGSTRSSGTPDG